MRSNLQWWIKPPGMAEAFWAADRRAWELAQVSNESFEAPRSVFRHIQGFVVAAAAARLQQLNR